MNHSNSSKGKSGWLIPSVLQQAKLLIRERLPVGGVAVDATVGNGHDTLFLTECVGETGHVYGFDIQKEALSSAETRLKEAGVLSRATLFQRGHERLADVLPGELKGKIHGVTFNLGYLPGGNKEIITQGDTTVQALRSAWEWLAMDGIITIVLYSGHPGGKQEESQVLEWAKSIDQKQAQVLWYQFINQQHQPPTLLAISKQN